MITKTTVNKEYQSLFEEIKAASNGTLLINNLEQFFGSIQEIAALNEKFLRLPLEEPMFEIDANTRKITIPDNFKVNGLSVQGDNLAETVFFCIDRYFDHTDLSNMKIRIKWKVGQVNGESVNFIKSTDIKPGFIVFGWPIAKDLTGKNGAISFAVEFYNESGYSLNTLVHSANIKEGLLLDNPIVVDVTSLIKDMLQNSQFGEGDAAVDDIIWLTNNGLIEDINLNEFKEEINLEVGALIPDDDPTSIPKKLYVNASAGIDAEIIYTTLDNLKLNLSEEYLLYTADALEEKGVYYIKLADGAYQKATISDLNNYGSEENPVELYKKYAVILADKANTYIVKAQGVKYDANDNKIGAGESTESTPVKVPQAKQPKSITIEKIGEDDLIEGSGYTRDIGIDNKIIFIDDSGVSLKGTPNFEDGYGALRYSWYQDNEAIEEGDWTFDAFSELDITEEGEYKLSVVNYRNATYAEPAESEVYTASYLASTLTARVTDGLDNGYITLDKNPDGGYKATARGILTINYEIANSDRSTQVRFALMNSENKEVNATFEDKKDGTALCTINSQYLTDGGEYYISVSNVYNGSIYTIKAAIDDGDKFTVNLK